MKTMIFSCLTVAFTILGSTSHAALGESETENWQCYTYHTGFSALIDRECMQKAYDATQFTGKPARCVMGQEVYQKYCQSSNFVGEIGTFAVVWPKR